MMSRFVRSLKTLCVCSFFATASFLHAQWQPLNQPFQANIGSIAESNGIMFAAESNGPYRSADGGKNWERLHPVAGHTHMIDIQKLARINSKLYAASSMAIFVSDDDGANWNQLQSELPGVFGITSIAVRGSTLFTSWGNDGIFSSVDGGITWVDENEGLPAKNVYALAFDETDIYALLFSSPDTKNGGVFRRNAGGGWSRVSPDTVTGQEMTIIGSHLFVWGWDGAFRSLDRGQTWQAITHPHPSSHGIFTNFVGSGNAMFAGINGSGIYRSTDNGDTWSPSGLESTSVWGLSTRGTTLIAGTSPDGIYLSHDNGATWEPANNGLHSSAAVASLAADDDNLYACSYTSGIYKAGNGTEWSPLPQPVSTSGTVAITSLTANNSTLVANTGTDGVLYLDTDSEGSSWQSATGLPNEPTARFITKNGSTLLAAMYNLPNPPADYRSIYLSTDEGKTWVPSELTIPVHAITSHRGALYASTPTDGLLISTDGGNRWTKTASDSAMVALITTLASNDQAIFAVSAQHGPLVSHDNGVTWVVLPSGLAGLRIAGYIVYGRTVFAATNLGVYRSEDDGWTWEAANAGIQNLAVVSPTVMGEYLYIGSYTDAVWRCPLSELVTTSVADNTPIRQPYSLQPHPVQSSSVLQLCSTCELNNATLTLSALHGRQVRTVGNLFGTSVVVERGDLTPGVYTFTLQEAGTVIASGTIVVE